jgi:hypothetical protein
MPALQTIDLSGQGIGSEEFVSSGSTLTQILRISGIPSETAFGSDTLTYDQTIQILGIPSAEAIGRVVIVPGLSIINLVGEGIPSEEAFGTPSLPQAILLTGIPSEEAFGTPYIQGIPANWSLKYLPPHNQVQSLYDDLICPCIDFVMLQDFVAFRPVVDQDILQQARALLVAGDNEALLAYFRSLIKPIVGTYRVIKLVISFMGFGDQTILYWYQYFNPSSIPSSLNPCGGNVVLPAGIKGNDFYFKVVAGVIVGSTFGPIKADNPANAQALMQNLSNNYDLLTNFIIQYKNERSTLEALKLAITYYIGGPYYGVGIFPGEKIEIYDPTISGQTALDERGSVWLIPNTFPCGI